MRRDMVPLLVIGVGYACMIAATTAFSVPSDVAVAIPIIALAVAVAVVWPARTRELRRPAERASYAPWIALLVVMAAWELFSYLVPGSRSEHPTLSSMADAVDRYFPLKALVALAWLSLGWMIVHRGAGDKATER
jgi:hypothetical protein